MNENTTASNYTIDPAHSSAQFSVRHMMISNVKGEFGKVSGLVVYDANNLEASNIGSERESVRHPGFIGFP